MSAQADICAGCRALEARIARIERALFLAQKQGVQMDTDVNDPRAYSMQTLITPKQIGNVRREAKQAGVDAEIEAQKLFACEVGALNRAAADKLITHLRKLYHS